MGKVTYGHFGARNIDQPPFLGAISRHTHLFCGVFLRPATWFAFLLFEDAPCKVGFKRDPEICCRAPYFETYLSDPCQVAKVPL